MKSRPKNRTEAVLLKLSKEEREKLNELAKIQCLSLSDYLRFVGLKTKIIVTTHKKELHE